MKWIQRLLVALTAVGVATCFTGCDRDGPFERAGERIDEAGDKIKDATN